MKQRAVTFMGSFGLNTNALSLISLVALLLMLPISINAASHNDGPHVFWQDDTTAAVLYLCEDSVVTHIVHAHDTVRFHGLCGDSDKVYTIPFAAPTIDTQTVFSGVSQIFAVSDIHGNYQPLLDILQAGGVLDSAGHWTWGDGHLVIVGDIFDRGLQVTECLWLIYRLEQEAKLEGGVVHYLIGNHEQMVMEGDLRYVNEAYTKGINKITRIAYDDLFGPESELGRWLRTKPTALVLNGTLFVHGGISMALVDGQFDLARLNEKMRECLDMSTSRLAFDAEARLLLGSLGPLWYRGYHYGIEGKYDLASVAQIDSVLGYYNADRVVVGHSEVENGINALFGGRVMAVDVDLETMGTFEGLSITENRFYRCTGDGSLIPLQTDR